MRLAKEPLHVQTDKEEPSPTPVPPPLTLSINSRACSPLYPLLFVFNLKIVYGGVAKW